MDFYVIVVGILFALAIFDLINGVSNDACNFLNSAIGSKAFSVRRVMIIAALGIFVGATFSDGMMDVARHGIFQPQYFYFEEIMAICIGMMLSDVILLDIFNTFGMPTSTTVSMVFDLLGGSFAISMLKIIKSGGMYSIGMLINTEKALSVIFAIFVSVALAFTTGLLVQYIARLLFTFAYKSRMKYFIGIFGGLSFTSIAYFILFKGFSGSMHVLPAALTNDTTQLLLIFLVGFTVFSHILYLLRVNVFKVIVGCGTFSLALSFAGNDLVNFIGVPLAGLSAFQAYSASGLAPDAILMTALQSSEKGQGWILTLAGLVMVLALTFSKKTKKVLNTSVSLSAQGVSEELFGTNPVARAIVRWTHSVSETMVSVVPAPVRRWINARFDDSKLHLEGDGAAFDLIRASVNLMLASLLIAGGTSLKLPLSTTYVTFMVAMGSSLADRAWGRESAVYRITGVLSVIGGWFITAFAAFFSCFLVTLVVYFGGIPVIIILFGIVVFILVRSSLRFKAKEEAKDDSAERFRTIMRTEEGAEVLRLVREHHTQEWGWFLVWAEDSYRDVVTGFLEEDLDLLRFIDQKVEDEKKHIKRLKRQGSLCSRKMNTEDSVSKRFFLYQANDFAGDLVFSMEQICEPCLQHVDNHFTPLDKKQTVMLMEIMPLIRDFIEDCARMVLNVKYDNYKDLAERGREIGSKIVDVRKAEMETVKTIKSNSRGDLVYLTILYESKALVDCALYLTKASRKLMTEEPS
jgi:phosphate/sulfate permease